MPKTLLCGDRIQSVPVTAVMLELLSMQPFFSALISPVGAEVINVGRCRSFGCIGNGPVTVYPCTEDLVVGF